MANWRPCVTEYCCSHGHKHTESVVEGVPVIGVRVLCGRITHCVTNTISVDRLGRMWLKVVPVCHAVVLVTLSSACVY